MTRSEQLELLFDVPRQAASYRPAAIPQELASHPAAPTLFTGRPDTLPPGACWREIDTALGRIGFSLQRSRRRSIGLTITAEGLRITAPTWVTLAQIDDAVREKARWIRATLHNYQINKQKLALTPMRWQAGAALYYLGKRIVLGIHGSQAGTYLAGNANAPQDGDILYLALADPADQARVRDATQAWLQQRARAWFGERLHYFLHTRGLKIRRWRLSSATTRWGSCSNDGSIMLSWRLIHFAPAIVDYVIAHELAHLRHMNHSRSFWDEVSQIFPAFESAKHALRRHASTYLPEH